MQPAINKIHIRTFRAYVYIIYHLFLLSCIKAKVYIDVHTKTHQPLTTEVYKFLNGVGQCFMSEIFNLATERDNLHTKQQYNLLKSYQSVSFPNCCDFEQFKLPDAYKNFNVSFKSAIK